MSQSPEAALESMISNLKAKTGRSLDEWLKIAKKSGSEKHGEIVAFLKKEHGVTHGYANLIAHQALQSDAVSVAGQGVDLVEAQYPAPRPRSARSTTPS